MRTAIPLVLAIATLAGCVGDEVQPTEDATPVITDPSDFSYLQNQTDGSGWHVHDYWGGKDQLTVVEGQYECLRCTVTYGGERGARLGQFQGEADQVIPQGAAWVNIMATWTINDAESSYDGVALYVKTAADPEPQFVSTIENGQNITINTTNEQNDPPHQRLSGWEFELRAMPVGDEARLNDFESRLTAIAIRGHEIPSWPPHPDLWNGASEITLVDYHGPGDAYHVRTPTYVTCSNQCLTASFSPADGLVVPYDATNVQITIEHEAGLPPDLALRYHGADSREFSTVTADEEDPLRAVYNIDPTGAADSPYALQSVWEFQVYRDGEIPIYAWYGGYSVTITVSK